MNADSPKPSSGSPEAVLTMGRMVTQVDTRSPADFLIRVLALGCCMRPSLPWAPNQLQRVCAGFLSSVTLGLVGVSTCPRGRSLFQAWFQAWVLSSEWGNPGMEAGVAVTMQAGTLLRLKQVCLVVQRPLPPPAIQGPEWSYILPNTNPTAQTAASCPLATLLFVLDVSQVWQASELKRALSIHFLPVTQSNINLGTPGRGFCKCN